MTGVQTCALPISNGTVTVAGNGAWHLNKNYPWKFGALGKDKISFDGCKADGDNISCTSAKATGLSGNVTVKIGVCNGSNCKSFTKDVTL